MRVFVTGASGYIGSTVAKAFRAKGHMVYGLVRTAESSNQLSLNEIWPIIGDMNNPDSYKAALEDVEVVVHCALEASEKSIELDAKTIDTVLGVFSKSNLPRAFIYTSGVWVYGSTNDKIVDESSPLNPPDIVKWRPRHEEKVLNATTANLRTVIMRPGVVYGKVGGLMNILFDSARDGTVNIIGQGSNRWAMIHIQDLAYAYVAAAEKELTRTVLNVADDSHFTVREMAEAIAKSAGIEGNVNELSIEDARKQHGDLIQGLALNQQVNNARIKRLLGWQIHHFPFIEEVDLYYNAWSASNQNQVF
ncbi:MAG: NAD-dependent epimerase/dehydratase family protein [Parachlamydiaceae bacterium]|nr:NAD-dependent epimerase/dehydratase family protein [Parachlamydiaceae bacterium]